MDFPGWVRNREPHTLPALLAEGTELPPGTTGKVAEPIPTDKQQVWVGHPVRVTTELLSRPQEPSLIHTTVPHTELKTMTRCQVLVS